MRRGILFIIAASFMLVATGCSSKSCKNSILQPDVIYEKALVNTKEAQIVRSLETKASVSATLLNEVFGDRYAYEDGVYLFIGIISERKISGDELPSFVHVKLNGKEPLEAKAIHRDDELYTLMPSVNRWGRYFLLKFPPSEAKTLKLIVEIDPYSPVELTFLRPTPRR